MAAKEGPATEFPKSIGKVATRELARSGYTQFDQLAKVSEKTLLAIHGVGPKAIRILAQELNNRGLEFAESPSSRGG
jgi:predicted flap endonuclease-1-like 5' DNA nuclease